MAKLRFLRKFIADSGADSYITIFPDYHWERKNSLQNIQVKIADCDRNIKLQFGCFKKKQAKKSLDKIRNLIVPLQAVQKALEERLSELQDS